MYICVTNVIKRNNESMVVIYYTNFVSFDATFQGSWFLSGSPSYEFAANNEVTKPIVLVVRMKSPL